MYLLNTVWKIGSNQNKEAKLYLPTSSKYPYKLDNEYSTEGINEKEKLMDC